MNARRLFQRAPWERTTGGLIGLGLVMLMQPLALALYTWSFPVILAGTVMFIVVSHLPD